MIRITDFSKGVPADLASLTDVWKLHEQRTTTEASRESGLLWIAVENPTDDELSALTRDEHVPQLVREELESGDQTHNHTHVTSDQTFVVARTLSYVEATSDVESGEFTVFFENELLITIERGTANVTPVVWQYLDRPGVQHPVNLSGIVLEVLTAIVRDYNTVDQNLADDVSELEQLVFDFRRGADPTTKIYALKREVAEARRAVLPLANVLRDQATAEFITNETTRRIIRKEAVTLTRIAEHIDGHDQLLGDMLSAHLSMVSVRQNQDMRKISAWGAMALVPTIIGAIYGMNFQHIPELSWTFGYPLALAATIVICGGLYTLFRRSGWM